jgi:hypothetical protein
MTDSSASPEQLAQLSAEVAKYIRRQHDKYRRAALPLSSEQRTTMSGYFSSDLLSSVRWLSLISELVETPTFFVMGLDLVDPSAFTMMAAITFSDVIVANVRCGTTSCFTSSSTANSTGNSGSGGSLRYTQRTTWRAAAAAYPWKSTHAC